ncbi:ATP-dependent RNA helicase HrpA [Aliiglaciecola sp. M165]|uniref:ATP-dependent RNA helicase HrpA n=1 Tax=Aliiglaciecola sp. M165 TaxID=2593649 RepID=UPI00391D55CA
MSAPNPPTTLTIKQMYDALPECLGADRHKLRRKIRQITKKNNEDSTERQVSLQQQILRSQQKRMSRTQNVPEIEYPDLPVSEHQPQIAEAILNNQVVIIAGETGSGKTTQIPKICLQLGRGIDGLIGHTQPRRLAARTVAGRIAEELNSELGHFVGYKVRFNDQVSENSYIKLMTDGILLAEMQNDRYLSQYDTLIIDEAHERSLNIDFILGFVKQLLPKRPDLKVIITSATIDPERFSEHFDQAPIIQVSGRTYPVEMRYRPLEEYVDGADQVQGIIRAVEELSNEKPGDILVFLSGEREIRDTADALQKRQFRHTEILPLYARLSVAEQNKIFHSHSGRRRIVLATNVAETSLTVPGIKYVVDPGFARLSRYSYRSKVQRLPIEAISQASANQRAGRCGRVSEGICIRLYSEDDFLNRTEFTDPEILRTNLASVILQMLSLKLGDIGSFPFVQPPDNRFVNDGFRLLEEIQAVEKREGKLVLTQIGRQISKLPIDPRYARMVVEAGKNGSLAELITIAAGLSIQDPRERPQDKRSAADQCHEAYTDKQSDFIALLNLWNQFKSEQKSLSSNQLRKWCQRNFINYLRMREWQDVVSQLKKAIVELGYRLNSQPSEYQNIHSAVLSGLLSHIGFKDKEREFLGARNMRFSIFPGSPISKKPPKWTVVAELVETSKLFGRFAAKIEPEWIEPLATHLTKSQYSEPYWSKRQGAVLALEKVLLFGVAIVNSRKVQYSHINPEECHEIFIREALVNGETKLTQAFIAHNLSLVEQVLTLEDKTRRRDVLVDEEDLVSFYQQRIAKNVVNEKSFNKWWKSLNESQKQSLNFDLDSLKKHQPQKANAFNYPDEWQQGNLRLALQYKFEPNHADDGVSVVIPLPLLNQVEEQGFDWLVPGFQHELIVTLIKSLPKKLRRNFVPAPNYADACMEDMSRTDKKGNGLTFIEALSRKLQRMTGIEVSNEEWQLQSLPAHLRFNFVVVDGQGKTVEQGRDLHKLKNALQGKVTQTLKKAAKPDIEKQELTTWSFGELETEYVDRAQGYEVKAYPGLVDEGKSVSIRLFDNKENAQASHNLGVRKLVKLNIPSPLSYLQEKLPNKAKLGLYFNPFGQVKALIDDCIDAAIDQMLLRVNDTSQSQIRDPHGFDTIKEQVRANINDEVLQIAAKVEKGLTLAHQIQKRLKGNVPLNLISAHGDIKQHLSSLVFPGFVASIGADKLDDWNRYITGIHRRLEKLPIDPNKDRMHQMVIDKVQQSYQSSLKKIPDGKMVPSELKFVRWMIEELRVSLFAQQLGTSFPISAKRIENHLQSF